MSASEAEVEAAARAVYVRRFPNAPVDEHFEWFHRYAADPASLVHTSNVALAFLDARAALAAAERVRAAAKEPEHLLDLRGLFKGRGRPCKLGL